MRKNIAIVSCAIVAMCSFQLGCKNKSQSNSEFQGDSKVKILSENEEIVIPFEIYRNDIRMKGKVNGKDCYVLLDNGSLWDELLFFGSPKVDSLGLNITGETAIGDSTVKNPLMADVDTSVAISFGNVSFKKQKGIITRYIPGAPSLWEGADVQISAAFFKNFVVEINFDKSHIKLTPPEKFKYDGNGQELKMNPGPHDSRTVSAKLLLQDGPEVSIDLLIDLGGAHPLYLLLGKPEAIQLPKKSFKTILGNGLNGPQIGYMGRVKKVILGKYAAENVVTAFAEAANIFGHTMLGLPLLQRFNITFDYPNERFFITPSRHYNRDFKFNMTGLELFNDRKGSLVVRRVFPDSPASGANIRVKDKITHINDKEITPYEPGEIRSILSKSGETVTFRIISKGVTESKSIKLREIL